MPPVQVIPSISPSPRADTSARRLLFFQHSSVYDGYGGVEYYLEDFTETAVRLFGSDHTWSILPLRGKPLTNAPSYQARFVPYPTNRWLRRLQNRLPTRSLSAAGEIIRAFKPTEIINTHVSLGPWAYALSRRFRIPFITLLYGIECWGDLWPQDEWALRRSDAFISISHWTKKILVDRGYDAQKIEIVHPRLPRPFLELKIPPRPARDTFTLLTLARLDPAEAYKGQDHVIQALKLLAQDKAAPKIRYIIQGNGDDRHRFAKMAQDLGVDSLVEFRPACTSREDLARVYAEADLYIMPSRFGKWEGRWRGEGFGIVYVEAALFGLPSIAYRCGGALDIILDGKTGRLIEQNDIAALADAIRFYRDQPSLRTAHGQNAREHILQSFSEEAVAREMRDSFSRIATLTKT